MALHPILQKIISTKESEVNQISDSFVLTPKKNNFYDSLQKKIPFVIAECKKASPSSGTIRDSYDPVVIAKTYEDCGAACISVLTDSKYFSGSTEDLRNVVSEVTVPVLRKDFIIDTKQIAEALSLGASAVLLIVRILSDSQLKDFYQYSESLGLGVLFEIHTLEELDRILPLKPKAIGINTRDLDTFAMHPNLISEIAPKIPEGILRIAESGIHSSKDIESHLPFVDGFLIGSYFMKSSNLSEAYRNLFPEKG
ncbi:MAG: indole-3-glycerol-phosphate synthase [Leptospiraceae bacterium]|nr:indole-3-glycerol-phosphate synthase [Leptospiraceae bacterium]MCP5511995.1 indole-3-glycerol-phosphate synthase [Leptospiraceae bacterium]